MQTIYHKKNELFEVEFYKDKECTEAFDLKNAQNLYIDGLNGDTTPLYEAYNRLGVRSFTIYTPYISAKYFWNGLCFIGMVKTLDDITPNLSKYIPEDNAVLFLTQEDLLEYSKIFKCRTCGMLNKVTLDVINESNIKKLTIFLPHGTQSELQKANEVAKELKKKYGVKEVNVVVLHCFIKDKFLNALHFSHEFAFNTEEGEFIQEMDCYEFRISKIITTNSTGILPVQDNECLQVIDSKEIFEEYLKTEIQFNKAKR